MHFTQVKLKSINTLQDALDTVDAIEGDYRNFDARNFAEWCKGGRNFKMKKGAQAKRTAVIKRGYLVDAKYWAAKEGITVAQFLAREA